MEINRDVMFCWKKCSCYSENKNYRGGISATETIITKRGASKIMAHQHQSGRPKEGLTLSSERGWVGQLLGNRALAM